MQRRSRVGPKEISTYIYKFRWCRRVGQKTWSELLSTRGREMLVAHAAVHHGDCLKRGRYKFYALLSPTYDPILLNEIIYTEVVQLVTFYTPIFFFIASHESFIFLARSKREKKDRNRRLKFDKLIECCRVSIEYSIKRSR